MLWVLNTFVVLGAGSFSRPKSKCVCFFGSMGTCRARLRSDVDPTWLTCANFG